MAAYQGPDDIRLVVWIILIAEGEDKDLVAVFLEKAFI
jgi:hypothetical protein